jgi:Glycosyltransferase sugar-binding region containing DXD motif
MIHLGIFLLSKLKEGSNFPCENSLLVPLRMSIYKKAQNTTQQSCHYALNRKVIHHMWLDKTVSDNLGPPERFVKFQKSWKKYNSDWDVMFWNRERIDQLIESTPSLQKYSHFYHNELKEHIEKCDVARIIVMMVYGGFYIDLDYECKKALPPGFENEWCVLEDHIDFDQKYLFFGRRKKSTKHKNSAKHAPEDGFGNHAPEDGFGKHAPEDGFGKHAPEDGFLSEKASVTNSMLGGGESAFWEALLDHIMLNYKNAQTRLVLYTTGPMVLTKFLSKIWLPQHPTLKPRIIPQHLLQQKKQREKSGDLKTLVFSPEDVSDPTIIWHDGLSSQWWMTSRQILSGAAWFFCFQDIQIVIFIIFFLGLLVFLYRRSSSAQPTPIYSPVIKDQPTPIYSALFKDQPMPIYSPDQTTPIYS